MFPFLLRNDFNAGSWQIITGTHSQISSSPLHTWLKRHFRMSRWKQFQVEHHHCRPYCLEIWESTSYFDDRTPHKGVLSGMVEDSQRSVGATCKETYNSATKSMETIKRCCSSASEGRKTLHLKPFSLWTLAPVHQKFAGQLAIKFSFKCSLIWLTDSSGSWVGLNL